MEGCKLYIEIIPSEEKLGYAGSLVFDSNLIRDIGVNVAIQNYSSINATNFQSGGNLVIPILQLETYFQLIVNATNQITYDFGLYRKNELLNRITFSYMRGQEGAIMKIESDVITWLNARFEALKAISYNQSTNNSIGESDGKYYIRFEWFLKRVDRPVEENEESSRQSLPIIDKISFLLGKGGIPGQFELEMKVNLPFLKTSRWITTSDEFLSAGTKKSVLYFNIVRNFSRRLLSHVSIS